MDEPPAHRRPERLLDAAGDAAPDALRPSQVLYVWGDRRTTSFTKYVTRIHALDF